ncbi:MAG: YitT family protein, partial [Paludibacteraceae bacterium]|nr:YitT family protein [Paludibacteraceae bacterium]
IDIGSAVAISGVVVSCTAFAVNPFRLVVIGIIGTWLNGIVIDYFTASLSKRKRVCIVTMTPEPIRDYIINNLVRGCSLYEIKGGYTQEPHTEIQSLLTRSEFGNLMEFIKDNSINAFIVASNVSEVYGLWFSKRNKKEIKSHHNLSKQQHND